MKRIIFGLCTFSLILILASCGTNNTDTTTGNESKPKEEKTITTKLEVKEDGNATFTIKNETNEEATLTYSSGQEVEYQLLDNEKNIVFTYSADKVFVLMMSENVIQPNEEVVIQLELKTELAEVPAGSYTLIAWSAAKELSDKKQEIAYEWAGK
ncbi:MULTISPECIES: BsuPI-related putative proteinase inhibitor [Psychrobacillus]|uniref:BsuPI-related putative proteinase inhibitor n=1 Tax=Psychrobacillus TaxID=1221880 RepID=UPI0030F5BD37